MKKVHFLNDPVKNIMAVILLTVLAYLLTLSFFFNNIIAGGLQFVFYPCYVALITVSLYLLSLLYFKKYNWVISLTGITVMFYMAFLYN
jgi:hypothetical protein